MYILVVYIDDDDDEEKKYDDLTQLFTKIINYEKKMPNWEN